MEESVISISQSNRKTQVSLQLMSKPLVTALYVTNSDKLFLWSTQFWTEVSQFFKQLPGIQPISYPLRNEMAPTLIFSEVTVMGRSNAQATECCNYTVILWLELNPTIPTLEQWLCVYIHRCLQIWKEGKIQAEKLKPSQFLCQVSAANCRCSLPKLQLAWLRLCFWRK